MSDQYRRFARDSFLEWVIVRANAGLCVMVCDIGRQWPHVEMFKLAESMGLDENGAAEALSNVLVVPGPTLGASSMADLARNLEAAAVADEEFRPDCIGLFGAPVGMAVETVTRLQDFAREGRLAICEVSP